MRILLTGGTGFLGSHVIPILREAGHEIVGTYRGSEAAKILESEGVEPVYGDLDVPESVDTGFQAARADALVNIASLGFGHAPTIVAAAEEAGIRRALFISTTALFTNLNASSKVVRKAAETLVIESTLDWTILRPTMIYGTPEDRNMARLLRLLRKSPVIPLPGRGSRLQQPVHVDDVAGAVAEALERPIAIRKAYDVGGPVPLPFRTILDQAADALGRSPVYIPVPLAPLIGVMRLYERIVPHPRLKAEQVERLAEDKAFDISAARKDLDFSPRAFSMGIEQEARLLQ